MLRRSRPAPHKLQRIQIVIFLTRISAIQVASQLGNSEVAIVARQLAEDETTPLVLRLSAVAGLGILKSPESVPLLQTLAKREDPIGNAARAALVRIN